MRSLVLVAALLVLCSACGSSAEDEPAAGPAATELRVAVPAVDAPWPQRLPAHLGAAGSNPVTDAIQVWRLGATYITSAPTLDEAAGDTGEDVSDEIVEEIVAAPGDDDAPQSFRGMDARSGWILTPPIYVQSAVPFSCAVSGNANEYRHVAALDDEDPLVRLQALVVLMRVKAPRSIVKQWKALQGLDALPDEPGLARLLGELHAAFEFPALKGDLQREPPADRYEEDHAQQWAARAAGVAQCWEALPRLTELSRQDNLDSSLAAERSLTEFAGPQADEALRRCVLGWQYNAWIHAAATLLGRDPALLERTLLEADVPQGSRYQVALFLGRLGNTLAVPMLCAEVGGVNRSDREMFDLIEALAGPEHRALVQQLPAQVRENQRARAEAVRAAVLARLREDGEAR